MSRASRQALRDAKAAALLPPVWTRDNRLRYRNLGVFGWVLQQRWVNQFGQEDWRTLKSIPDPTPRLVDE